MDNTFTQSSGALAEIFLKNGKKFFGILLNDLETPDSFDHEVRYVKPENHSHWIETADGELIERLDTEHVDGIDLYLK